MPCRLLPASDYVTVVKTRLDGATHNVYKVYSSTSFNPIPTTVPTAKQVLVGLIDILIFVFYRDCYTCPCRSGVSAPTSLSSARCCLPSTTGWIPTPTGWLPTPAGWLPAGWLSPTARLWTYQTWYSIYIVPCGRSWCTCMPSVVVHCF